jgi:hypothetical protein
MSKLSIPLAQISISLILVAVVIGAILPGVFHTIFAIGAIIFSITAHVYNISITPALSPLSISLLLVTGLLGYQGQTGIHIPIAILTAIVSILAHKRAISILPYKIEKRQQHHIIIF